MIILHFTDFMRNLDRNIFLKINHSWVILSDGSFTDSVSSGQCVQLILKITLMAINCVGKTNFKLSIDIQILQLLQSLSFVRELRVRNYLV